MTCSRQQALQLEEAQAQNRAQLDGTLGPPCCHAQSPDQLGSGLFLWFHLPGLGAESSQACGLRQLREASCLAPDTSRDVSDWEPPVLQS